jgi:hypothetical protein
VTPDREPGSAAYRAMALLRIYAKSVVGQDELAKRRILLSRSSAMMPDGRS